jgi:hypothetical protein
MGFFALSIRILSAQGDNISSDNGGSFTIRVEAREVIVPVFVAYKNIHVMYGLNLNNFHIFEDKIEQPVTNLRTISSNIWNVTDSVLPSSSHIEYSGNTKGIWYSPDQPQPDMSLRGGPMGINHTSTFIDSMFPILYLLSYTPPPSFEGACHQIKVTVDQSDAVDYARDEYCNVKHSAFDPLDGTKVGEMMKEVAESKLVAELPLAVQAAATFSGSSEAFENISIDLPWRSYQTVYQGCRLKDNVKILALVYTKEGRLVTRFSDESLTSSGWINIKWRYVDCSYKTLWLSSRYVTQIDLHPGSYYLKIVVFDGESFGRADLPIEVDRYDRNGFAVSDIVLCKRFTSMNIAWSWTKDRDFPWSWVNGKEPGYSDRAKLPINEISTAPEYHPLVSKGNGFTPAGDTVFHKKKHSPGDRMFSYFEVYEPALASGLAKVQYEMRVIDAKTDKTIVDTGFRSADSFVNSGKLIIPIAEEIAINKLPTGAYRVEVQASDSTGMQTPWRSASFTVE